MSAIEDLLQRLPDFAEEQKRNLEALMEGETLSPDQTFGCAIASAWFLKDEKLAEAFEADARDDAVGEDVIQDARAAAVQMGMTTVYYRTKHLVKDEALLAMTPKLRMGYANKAKTDKAHFELFALGPGALSGCADCINAHVAGMQKHGMSAGQAHDAIRIASVVSGISVALHLS